jgi:hypothetical protein
MIRHITQYRHRKTPQNQSALIEYYIVDLNHFDTHFESFGARPKNLIVLDVRKIYTQVISLSFGGNRSVNQNTLL